MATVIDEEMKTLRQTAVDANVVLQVLSTIGLNSHGIFAVLEMSELTSSFMYSFSLALRKICERIV